MRKLVIEDTVKVPVKFGLNSNGKNVVFNFTVICDRIDQKETKNRMGDDTFIFSDFLASVMKGWEGQKLVVEDDGTPSEFDEETRDLLLGVPGVAKLIFDNYTKEVGAKEKN